MTNRNGVSRGDRNRNARLARLRELVPFENAIVGIDLAGTAIRWWWSATTTRGCWPGGRFGAARGTSVPRWTGRGPGDSAGVRGGHGLV
jgi:hypothetical protein